MNSNSRLSQNSYFDVWGDTVRLPILFKGVVVAITCALAGLYGGRALLALFINDPKLVEVLSLVTGLVACVLAGVITAKLSAPARIITEQSHDTEHMRQALAELASQPHGLGRFADASPKSQQEMRDAGLAKHFEERN